MSDLVRIVKAADFAAKKHKDQRRKDPDETPYINHPIGVAQILTSEGEITNPDIIIGALLHDTVEDTETTLDEIEQLFGENVRKIVDQVSDDKTLTPFFKGRTHFSTTNMGIFRQRYTHFVAHETSIIRKLFVFYFFHQKMSKSAIKVR